MGFCTEVEDVISMRYGSFLGKLHYVNSSIFYVDRLYVEFSLLLSMFTSLYYEVCRLKVLVISSAR